MAEGPTDDSSERVGYISHAVSKEDLKPGDHIYCCYRVGAEYTQHGIYIGEQDCEVIHFNGSKKEFTTKEALIKELQNVSFQDQEIVALIEKFKVLENDASSITFRKLKQRLSQEIETTCIRKTALSEFCNGSSIRLVAYNCTNPLKLNHTKHKVKAMPMEETLKLARHFLSHPEKWGEYHVRENNCETFACFCKTGLMNIAAQLHPERLGIYELTMEPYTTAEEALENYSNSYQ